MEASPIAISSEERFGNVHGTQKQVLGTLPVKGCTTVVGDGIMSGG
jgi:hypothetical protein